jgi:hypothetical protein
MAKRSKVKTKANGGRTKTLTPSAPKAGVTGKRTRYGCGGKLK